MLEPLSIGACLFSSGFLSPHGRGSSAVSYEAEAVRKAQTVLVESVERSQALFGVKASAIAQLRTLANECSEPDWDGNGAEPLDPVALANAEEFLRALPGDLPLPELAADPDGSVSLDWIQSRTRVFSVSVGASRRLAYAWLDGSDRGHAVSRFDGSGIPLRVLQGIREIVIYGHASLRTA